jgi:hypothetical protein
VQKPRRYIELLYHEAGLIVSDDCHNGGLGSALRFTDRWRLADLFFVGFFFVCMASPVKMKFMLLPCFCCWNASPRRQDGSGGTFN